ncbi:cation-transporting P-type ATPase [Desulfopila sp. IMCC35006]|uniref:cation-translocating P-type ATPase n=1 Tax=Desulfopila sp. IMCC35006 TaxID=2569542 RepID=UPI0010AC52A7|nr:cation-transporting P-type ATPase [Desulfopila sp. IMCC35006]TKB27385.1 cation-transporting P-type ATPase [Desulfopila sp. IMCC35006]
MNKQPAHIGQIPPEQVHAYLHTRPEGLALSEVTERLIHVGKNQFELNDPWKLMRSLGRQFTNFFAVLLFFSAGICFIAHRINPAEDMGLLGWAVFGVAIFNALFGFFQEYRAEKAMEALKQFLPNLVEVCRQNKIDKIAATEIVPGDVIILMEGCKIPADVRIVESESLMVNNSPLTGESAAIRLSSQASDRPLEECQNIGFAGCTVVKGTGRGVVFATGLRTFFGRIANLSQATRSSSSPLEREISHMVRVLTIIACTMGTGFFLYGMLTGKPLWMNLVFMMGIIVANVPEGLLPTLTLALAMGSLRMARKNVLVTSLNAVASLGAVHVVCTDKTGTLTENKLTVTRMINPRSGETLTKEQELELATLAFCTSDVRQAADGLLGDPLDVAMAENLLRLGLGDLTDARRDIICHFAFDVEKRRSAGIARSKGSRFFVVKGAFEAIRPLVSGVEPIGGSAVHDIPLPRQLAESEQIMQQLAAQGLRVITIAYRLISGDEDPDKAMADESAAALEHDLILAGFIGIEDPIRPEVPQAVAKCHGAGIDVIMITGDHPATALAIAAKAGIVAPGDTAHLTGEALNQLTIADLSKQLQQGVRIFARTTPEQKMKIVTALKYMDRVVAMTGDGVNDAPALRAADIGIAMGKQGTDVARESAHLILLDDNFAAIVDGIEEGRTVFENMKKFTSYVLVHNVPEILPYLLYIVLPVPPALNIMQILLIDLGTDIIPSMGLGQEPADSEVMKKRPDKFSQQLLTPKLVMRSYCFLGIIEAIWSLFLFFYVLVSGGWQYGTPLAASSPLYQSATGITLATIILMQIGNLVGRRYEQRSGLDRGLLTNRLLLAGILVQILFSWATLYFQPLQKILRTGPVEPAVYGLAWLGVVLIFGIDYLRKLLFTRGQVC